MLNIENLSLSLLKLQHQCENVQEHIPTQKPQNEPAAEKSQPEPEQVLRRSERVRRPPDKLNL